ncbi:hypothetical protein HDU97_000893 [Phlyctochytrium planicorne]|nr:hypothetical protein HDU97_000881 [Phlyctochytrium planicorne]KAJ3102050.1 hypothetical protein HDU97_000893 [Phlyctochytrium planicorne]
MNTGFDRYLECTTESQAAIGIAILILTVIPAIVLAIKSKIKFDRYLALFLIEYSLLLFLLAPCSVLPHFFREKFCKDRYRWAGETYRSVFVAGLVAFRLHQYRHSKTIDVRYMLSFTLTILTAMDDTKTTLENLRYFPDKRDRIGPLYVISVIAAALYLAAPFFFEVDQRIEVAQKQNEAAPEIRDVETEAREREPLMRA